MTTECAHMRRQVKDSRPRLLAGMRSTRRASTCNDCGYRWTSYEMEASQLDELMRKVSADLIGDLVTLVDKHRQRTPRGAIVTLYGETDGFANRGQGDENSGGV